MFSIYRTIVFDLDGTLANTLSDIARAFNTVLEQNGYPIHEVSKYQQMVGWGLSRTLELALDSEPGTLLKKKMLDNVLTEYRQSPVTGTSLYKGIDNLISVLKADSVRLFVYTNKEETLASTIVDGLFSKAVFEGVIGGSDDYPAKPDPTSLFSRIGEENRGDSSILFVGDSEIDMKTASNAGFTFAAAGWGYGDSTAFENGEDILIFDRPSLLQRWIQGKGTVI